MNKQYRVKESKEIEGILSNRDSVGNRYLAIYKKQNSKTDHFRYAISAGKKIGNAVTRNRVKRQIRAALDILNINLDKNTDVFIIAKATILDLSFQELLKQLEYLFKKLKLIKG